MRVKKRIRILLIAALLALLVPHAASANSPHYVPWQIKVECTGVGRDARIDVLLLRADGSERREERVYDSAQNGTSGYFRFRFEDGEEMFCLICVGQDGTETRSEPVRLVEYGQYTYDGTTNRLVPNGTYYSAAKNCGDNIGRLLLAVLLLFVPLGVTLLVECLAAFVFRIRPVKYVFAINAVTNPIMNLLLLIFGVVFAPDHRVYWIVLGVMEIAATWIEYRFYAKKYPETPRRRLLLFSIAANAASLLIGIAALTLFL